MVLTNSYPYADLLKPNPLLGYAKPLGVEGMNSAFSISVDGVVSIIDKNNKIFESIKRNEYCINSYKNLCKDNLIHFEQFASPEYYKKCNLVEEVTAQLIDNKAPIKSFDTMYPQINELLSKHNPEELTSKQVKLFGDFILDAICSNHFTIIDVLLKKLDGIIKGDKNKYSTSVLLAVISISAHVKKELVNWSSLKSNIKNIFIEAYGDDKTSNMFRGLEA